MQTPDLDMLSADIIPARDLDAADMCAWRAILGANPALASPFFSPEFTTAVAHVRDDVHVVAFRERSLPLAFLPFQFANRWTRAAGAAERVGGKMSDFFGLIAGPGISIPPADLLRHARLNSLELSHLVEDQAGVLNGERPDMGLQAGMTGGWEAYWAERRRVDKAFVADTERSRRRIAQDLGSLTFTFDDRRPDILAALIDAKRAQYRATGVEDALGEGWTRDLLQTLARTRSIRCTGFVSTLMAGDTWVASHFGLASNQVLHSWFPVYNPDLARYSPGRLLLRDMMETASARGIRMLDFGAGEQAYKRKFATGEYRLYRGHLYRPNLAAFGFRVAQSIGWRLKPALAAKAN